MFGFSKLVGTVYIGNRNAFNISKLLHETRKGKMCRITANVDVLNL